MNGFWAYRWLDAYGVRTLKHVRKVLSDRRALEQLHEMASTATGCPRDEGVELVAGRGLDLSGHLDCYAPECRRRQVDDLLRHAWHYFDRVVVADGLSHEVSYHWDPASAQVKKWLGSHLEVLLYLRAIGAEDLVVFHEKPAPCELHLAKHASDAGLPPDLDADDELLRSLADEADIQLTPGERHRRYVFLHPKFEHTVWGEIEPGGHHSVADATARRAVVQDVARRYVAHRSSDVSIAHHAAAPLGSVVWLHGELLRRASRQITPAEVLFQLDLPILKKVSVAALLRLRRDEADAFQQFRTSLRKAAAERLRHGASDAGQIAEDIRRDMIEPELARIRQKLTSAERVLRRKAAVGFGLGSLVTVCGLLAGLAPPIAVTGGVGTLATVTATAALKDIDERREISLAEMYFLWQALKHAPHRH